MLETDLFLKFSVLCNLTTQILTVVIDFWVRLLAVWAQCPSHVPEYIVIYAVFLLLMVLSRQLSSTVPALERQVNALMEEYEVLW